MFVLLLFSEISHCIVLGKARELLVLLIIQSNDSRLFLAIISGVEVVKKVSYYFFFSQAPLLFPLDNVIALSCFFPVFFRVIFPSK